jgi:hypothetical protein
MEKEVAFFIAAWETKERGKGGVGIPISPPDAWPK